MNNYFYTNEIANKIKELLDDNLPKHIVNISVGDFTILPLPDDGNFEAYFPAVIIQSDYVDNEAANQSLGIYSQEYHFKIQYMYPYTFEKFQDVPAEASRDVQIIANILLTHNTLENLSIQPQENEQGGWVLAGEVKKIEFDSAENQLFRQMFIPVSTAQMQYTVIFRTYQGR